MNFTVTQKELNATLNVVIKAVKQNPVFPILEHVKVNVTEETIVLTCSNQNVELSATINAKNKDAVSFCIPAKKLSDLVKNLADQPLSFEVKDGKAKIKSSSGKYEIPTESVEDFPVFNKDKDADTFSISATDFFNGINKTEFAVLKESVESRPNMAGVFIELSDKIIFTATDSHRMNHCEFKASPAKGSFIIPSTSLPALPDAEGQVLCSLSKNSISLSFENGIEFNSSLVDEKFPDYKAIIPVNEKGFEVGKNEIIGALKRVIGFANGITKQVKLTFGKTVILSGEDKAYSENAEETLNGKWLFDDLQIGLNGSIMLESLQSLDGDIAYFSLSEANRAVILKDDPKSENYILLMPMVIS
jgi:DNA polymerase-3 subunit beta